MALGDEDGAGAGAGAAAGEPDEGGLEGGPDGDDLPHEPELGGTVTCEACGAEVNARLADCDECGEELPAGENDLCAFCQVATIERCSVCRALTCFECSDPWRIDETEWEPGTTFCPDCGPTHAKVHDAPRVVGWLGVPGTAGLDGLPEE